MMKYDKLPRELKELNQWVCTWSDSKIPMQGTMKKSASASDSSTWCSFEQAEYMVDNDYYDYIGFVFDNNGIVGIDIDVGFEDGLMTPICADIMYRCQSYTEYSKSKRGVHIFVRGSLPYDGKNNRKGIEIYQAKRFFVTTGDQFLYKNIIENQDAINYILQTYFSDEPRNVSEKPYTGRLYEGKYCKPCEGKIPLKPQYPVVNEGGRNYALCSLAGQLFSSDMDYDEVLRELHTVNKKCFIPSLEDEEVERVCKSIYKYYEV